MRKCSTILKVSFTKDYWHNLKSHIRFFIRSLINLIVQLRKVEKVVSSSRMARILTLIRRIRIIGETVSWLVSLWGRLFTRKMLKTCSGITFSPFNLRSLQCLRKDPNFRNNFKFRYSLPSFNCQIKEQHPLKTSQGNKFPARSKSLLLSKSSTAPSKNWRSTAPTSAA